MFRKTLQLYKDAYGGLSNPIWFLSIINFINRSGTMVVPFMSIYLTQKLKFSVDDTGLILSAFGIGSMGGSFLGGWLTDKIGHYKVQFWSLVLGGCSFFVLALMQTFYEVLICVFFLSLISEALRPANSTAIAHYANPKNVTRAYSLNRLAFNLGFTVAPAIGGFLASKNYHWLFIIDGTTCIISGLSFRFFLSKSQNQQDSTEEENQPALKPQKSAYKDSIFIAFMLCASLFGICFVQLFSIFPMYLREVCLWEEWLIGLVLSMNGFVIVLTEMLIVYRLENYPDKLRIIRVGIFLVGLSFITLNISYAYWAGIACMLLASFGEILSMPFMSTFMVERSTKLNRGQYAALFTLSWSLAHTLSPLIATQVIKHYSYAHLWNLIFLFCILAITGFMFIAKKTKPVKSLIKGSKV